MSLMLQEKRVSRGTRMAELVGEAADQDETFWNDAIWQEAESDEDSFVAEEEKPDVFDSDFNDSETEEESDSDDEKKVATREKSNGQQNKYKEPQKIVLKRKTQVDENGIAVVKKKVQHLATDLDMNMTARAVRDTTKVKSIHSDLARNIKAEHDKSKPRQSHQRIRTQFNQKDLLIEGLDTEELNKKWLVTQKLVEDERSKADRPAKTTNNEQFVRFQSRRGSCNTITFSSVDSMPSVLTNNSVPQPVVHTCVITGKPARYRDPRTGHPYHDLAAFKELRRRFGAMAVRRLNSACS